MLTAAQKELLWRHLGKPLPLTKRQRKALILSLSNVIYRTFSDARIESMKSYDDTLLSRLDRIEGHAYAAAVAIIERTKS